MIRLLLLGADIEAMKRLVEYSSLQPREVKNLHKVADVHGFQNLIMLVYPYAERVPEYNLIVEYAASHNIGLVRGCL